MFDKNEVYVQYSKDKNDGILTKNKLENKLLLVMAYIRLNISQIGEVNTSINMLVTSIGYSPNRNIGKINNIVIDQLQWLETNNYIFINADLSKIKPSDCFTITINDKHNIFDMTIEDSDGKEKLKPHVMLTYTEFDKITKSKTSTDKGSLLRVFLNIKKRINMSKETGGWTWCSGDLLLKECEVSRGYSISTPIKELCDIGLLFEYKTGSYVDLKGNTLNAPNIYMLKANTITKQQATDNMLNWCKEFKGVEIDSFMPITKPNSKKKKDIIIEEGVFGENCKQNTS